jgi:hypothetical protein
VPGAEGAAPGGTEPASDGGIARGEEPGDRGLIANYWRAGLIAEREHLLSLADDGFGLASLHFPPINASGCAKALTNSCSAPLPVGTSFETKVYLAYVEIRHQAKCVDRMACYRGHPRSFRQIFPRLHRRPIQRANSVPTRPEAAKLANALGKNAHLQEHDSEVLIDGIDKTAHGGNHPGKDS